MINGFSIFSLNQLLSGICCHQFVIILAKTFRFYHRLVMVCPIEWNYSLFFWPCPNVILYFGFLEVRSETQKISSIIHFRCEKIINIVPFLTKVNQGYHSNHTGHMTIQWIWYTWSNFIVKFIWTLPHPSPSPSPSPGYPQPPLITCRHWDIQ